MVVPGKAPCRSRRSGRSPRRSSIFHRRGRKETDVVPRGYVKRKEPRHFRAAYQQSVRGERAFVDGDLRHFVVRQLLQQISILGSVGVHSLSGTPMILRHRAIRGGNSCFVEIVRASIMRFALLVLIHVGLPLLEECARGGNISCPSCENRLIRSGEAPLFART